MPKCLLTYKNISKGDYSQKGLSNISKNLHTLSPLPYTVEEQIYEHAKRSTKMSIQGVQIKLSAKLTISKGEFKIVDNGGTYIIKPQSPDYKELPENEDLTMHLASLVGIEVPLHGLIKGSDNRLSYFIKRFDRLGRGEKRALEDFSQLQLKGRDTKYNSSVEKVIKTIFQFATFPKIESLKYYRRFLFNFITGNEDMHLKNYSLINNQDVYQLAPAYDFLNTTIALHNPKEESALPINGKKRSLTKNILTSYLPHNLLNISNKNSKKIVDELTDSKELLIKKIEQSFLLPKSKEKYIDLLSSRLNKIKV